MKRYILALCIITGVQYNTYPMSALNNQANQFYQQEKRNLNQIAQDAKRDAQRLKRDLQQDLNRHANLVGQNAVQTINNGLTLSGSGSGFVVTTQTDAAGNQVTRVITSKSPSNSLDQMHADIMQEVNEN